MTRTRLAALVLAIASTCAGSTEAGGPALLRVARRHADDRTTLIQHGITLVLERESAFLALGDAAATGRQLQAMGRDALVVDTDTSGWRYFAIGLRVGAVASDLAACGDVLLAEEDWALLRTAGELSPECLGSPRFFVRWLPLQPLRPARPVPEAYAAWQEVSQTPRLATNPTVQQIVSGMTDTAISANWDELITAATTRYSTSAGCQTAAQVVHTKLQALGLNPVYQQHTSGHAPNVVGTIVGQTHPEKVVIIIGHLDDMPSSGSAPGADDNASGAATVTSAAQAMAGFTFANTVRFVAVTGEEQGLYGSEHYAGSIGAGEQVLGVLNADMTGWQGDGLPSTGETLDLNTNSSSHWLGLLMQQCAADYGTGCAVDPFQCPSMVYSDHAPFWDLGYPAVCGITDNEGSCGHGGSYPYYHKSTDTRANCGAGAFFYGTVKAYVATAAHLAEALCAAPYPTPPTTVNAQADGDNRIAVSWSSAGSGLTYEVWRTPGGCAATHPAIKVGETTGTSLVDSTASGSITYAYRVRVRKAECLSTWSLCTTASTTGSCLEPPSFEGLAGVTNGAVATCTLGLSWNAATAWCGGPLGYNVHRSTVSPFTPSPANRIATGVPGLAYTDAIGLQSGTAYHYVVRATDAGNTSEDANTMIRTGVPTGAIAIGTWTDTAGDSGTATLTPQSPWTVATSGGHSGPKVYRTGTYGNNQCVSLTSPPLLLGTGSQLTFWSHYDIESNWDKGQVEVSQDNGTSWQRLTVTYPSSVSNTGDACGLPSGRTYFSGTNATWASYTGSLAAYANSTVRLRWRLSTDTNTTGQGWWIDDVTVTNVQTPASCATGTGCTLTCGTTVPSNAPVGTAVGFQSTATPSNCTGTPSFAWSFGDGGSASTQNASHTFPAPGTYPWTVSASIGDVGCTRNGTIEITMSLSAVSVAVDAASHLPGSSNANRVLEPGEQVVVSPTWHNNGAGAGTVNGSAAGLGGPAGATYTLLDATAAYGSIAGGADAASTDSYALGISDPASRPALHWDATLMETLTGGTTKTWTVHIGRSFGDVQPDHWAYREVEALYHARLTRGCIPTTPLYCPDSTTTRAEMAVFLVRAKHGPDFVPPAPTGTLFTDVPASFWAAPEIEHLAADGITKGCGLPGRFCPDSLIQRSEMAVFLLRLRHGGDYVPPAATGTVFTDVPLGHWAAAWIEQLFAEGLTTGCTPTTFCPEATLTRAEMATFLGRTLGL
ncbi:MAG: M28 family peptidase, partial [Thermoanaerobaculaceae bacterium]|nr:M28 family peptidase [Thermoanaerobaculaceae bacterium]